MKWGLFGQSVLMYLLFWTVALFSLLSSVGCSAVPGQKWRAWLACVLLSDRTARNSEKDGEGWIRIGGKEGEKCKIGILLHSSVFFSFFPSLSWPFLWGTFYAEGCIKSYLIFRVLYFCWAGAVSRSVTIPAFLRPVVCEMVLLYIWCTPHHSAPRLSRRLRHSFEPSIWDICLNPLAATLVLRCLSEPLKEVKHILLVCVFPAKVNCDVQV